MTSGRCGEAAVQARRSKTRTRPVADVRVARLRERKTDGNPLVYRINMEAGHGGKSGRFQRYHEIAESFAFMLEQVGIKD